MSSNYTSQLKALRTVAADGTLSYPRFAEEQLIRLFNTLSEQRDALVAALVTDVGATTPEAQVEVAEVLQLVKDLAAQADFAMVSKRKETELAETGAIKKGKGIVVVKSDEASPVYSTIAPLATAISTGNAVVCVLPSSTSAISSLLRTSLTASLNRSAYLFALSSDFETIIRDFGGEGPALVVSRATSRTATPSISSASGTSGSTVLVDRLTSNSSPSQIARLVLRGKFHRLGRLSGSVGRVLVHETSSGLVVDALLRELKEAYGVDAVLSGDYGRFPGSNGWNGERFVRDEREKGSGKILAGGARTPKDEAGFFPPTVVFQPSRDLFQRDVSGPLLLVDTFTSHEDALVKLKQLDSTVLYLFSDSATIEYLAVETTAKAIYGNDITLSALYDPHKALSNQALYTTTTSLVRASSASTATSLFAPFTPSRLAAVAALFPRERRLSWNRKAHSGSVLRVFFLQGVFLSLGSILVVFLGSAGWAGWLATKWIKRTYFA